MQSKLAEANLRLSNQVKRTREEGRKAGATFLRSGVGAGAAFGVSYAESKWPDNSKVFGVDLSLLVGIGASAAGALGLAGDKQTSDLLEAAGLGALCAYASKMGTEEGLKKPTT